MPALSLQGVSKAYPGVQALADVSFEVAPGTVHALCGENGAGKSTILRILSGVTAADAGQIQLFGAPYSPASPRAALDAGCAVIYQELNLVPALSVAENVFLGHMPSRRGLVDRGELAAHTQALLDTLGLEVGVWTRVCELSIGQRQLVEIAKALSRDAKLIAFDEPTSSLSSREVERLFTIIRGLRDSGRSVLYVTHRMAEIEDLCDAATVLRDGRHVVTIASLAPGSTDVIVENMVGRALSEVFPVRVARPGAIVFEAESITGPGLVEPVSLQLREGEIVGLFGLVGAGRTELLKAIFGDSVTRLRLAGREIVVRSPRDAIAAGIALAPEDRKGEALFGRLTVLENIAIASRERPLIDDRAEQAAAQRQAERLGIKTPSLRQSVGALSGGNQQKTVLARWLERPIKVLLLDEPTRGIDVGAKSEIYRIIHELAGQGIAIVVASSELPEVVGLCDRVLVMREGRLSGEAVRGVATEESLLRLALPVSA